MWELETALWADLIRWMICTPLKNYFLYIWFKCWSFLNFYPYFQVFQDCGSSVSLSSWMWLLSAVRQRCHTATNLVWKGSTSPPSSSLQCWPSQATFWFVWLSPATRNFAPSPTTSWWGNLFLQNLEFLTHKPVAKVFYSVSMCVKISLAVSDILVGLVAIPCAVLTDLGRPRHNLPLCLVLLSILMVLTQVGTLTCRQEHHP